ncbi:MAG: Gfo/Idh/MocA family protein [Candidatus Cloacimonadia bacterium]
MLKAGVIGYGYWGPNIVRNLNANPNIAVKKVCDLSDDRLKLVHSSYPDIETTPVSDDVLLDTHLDLVAIVTPVFTHYELAKKALLNGKHIFVEKPFTSTSAQAEELIEIAEKKNLKIIVDHTFLFTGAVRKMKELVENGILGNLYYYDSVRVNLGLFQHDINVIWDLGPHDISIMEYLIDNLKPLSVNAVGAEHFNRGLEDVAYLTVRYENNFIAHFHLNWLSPVKVRYTLVAGDKKMLVWNDMLTDEKIKVYDKGVKVETAEGVYNLLVQYRSGDMYSPTISNVEALKLETEYLVDYIMNNKKIDNDGIAGLNVVRILEAADVSLKNGGREVKI